MIYRGAKYGALAGFIATWSVSAAMVTAELALGLQISLFYYVVGRSLGLNDTTSATYLGFSLHILAGTLLGAVVGVIMFRWRKRVTAPMRERRILIGIGAGIIMVEYRVYSRIPCSLGATVGFLSEKMYETSSKPSR